MSDSYTVEYAFILPDGRREEFVLDIDPDTMMAMTLVDEYLPEWTKLEFNQCSHCPLNPAIDPYCPLARRLRGLVNRFQALVSHERLIVEIRNGSRFIREETSAQQGLGAFMGLLMATCGCPHMAFFKPMARHNLSSSSHVETIYRAASMYLVAQYFRHVDGKAADLELDGLLRIYENIHLVNKYIAQRLRSASEADALVNAIVILDGFAHMLPLSINQSLKHVRPMFTEFLQRLDDLEAGLL